MNSFENKKHISRFKLIIRLLWMVKNHKWLMLQAIFYGILNHLTNILLIVYGAWLITGIFLLPSYFPSIFELILLFILAIIKAVSAYMEQIKNHDVAFRLLADLRVQFFEKLEPLTPGNLIRKRSGDLISTIGGDIEMIEVFFAHTISPIVIAGSISVFILSFLGFWWILLPFFIFPFYFTLGVIIPIFYERFIRKNGKVIRNTLGSTNAHLIDSLQGIKTILLFNQGKSRLQQIADNGLLLNKVKRKSSTNAGLLIGIINLVIFTADIAIIIAAIQGFAINILDIRGVIVVIVATISSFGPLSAISSISHHLTQTFAAAERLFNIIDEKPIVVDSPDCSSETPERFDITFKNLSFKYSPEEPLILNDFNLKIPQGSKIALIGESGSGKTTILRILLRFWDFESGEIFIGGKDLKKMYQKNIHEIIAIVEQDTFLFDLSIKDNIAMGNYNVNMEDIIKCAKMANIHEFIMSLSEGYDTQISELGDKLSSGEKQRIAISRALIKNAPILLLDEPTSNLDTLNENALQKTLNTIIQDKTVIIVAHRSSMIANVDNIFLLKDGKCCEIGNWDNFVVNGKYNPEKVSLTNYTDNNM